MATASRSDGSVMGTTIVGMEATNLQIVLVSCKRYIFLCHHMEVWINDHCINIPTWNELKVVNLHCICQIDHYTGVAKLPGLIMELRLPVTSSWYKPLCLSNVKCDFHNSGESHQLIWILLRPCLYVLLFFKNVNYFLLYCNFDIEGNKMLNSARPVFQVSIQFHPLHPWLQTTKNKFNALHWLLVTKLQHYFLVFIDARSSFSILKVD